MFYLLLQMQMKNLHTHTHSRTRTHKHIYTHVHASTHIHLRTRTRTHTHTHTHTHVHIHTHKHTHAYLFTGRPRTLPHLQNLTLLQIQSRLCPIYLLFPNAIERKAEVYPRVWIDVECSYSNNFVACSIPPPSTHRYTRKFRLKIYSMNTTFFSLSCFGDLSRIEFLFVTRILLVVLWYIYLFPVTALNRCDVVLFIRFHPSNEISSLEAFDTPPPLRLETTLNIHFCSRDVFQCYYFIFNNVSLV